jgi:hypothetical protein
VKAFPTERLLARTFFARFFESDIAPDLPQGRMVIWSIAILAAPGYLLSFLLAIEYGQSRNLAETIQLDKLFFVTFGMLALGVVALIVWEGVFPDRRDARILGTLPLATRAHVIGRLGALGALAALFCIGINLPSAILYGLTLWGRNAAPGPVRAIAAHLMATALGGAFVFFLLITVQGVLLSVFGQAAAQRLALFLQIVFMVMLLQTLFFLPFLGRLVLAASHGGDQSILVLLPSAWFLALYEVLVGTPRPLPAVYALVAVGGTVSVVVAATVLLAGSYQRLVRLALETPLRASGEWTGFLVRAARTAARIAIRDPVQRAVAGFTLRTVVRIRSHRMLLAISVGVAIAIVQFSVVPLVAREGTAALDSPAAALLSASLVLNFLMLCGVRALFTIPTELKSNWVFRLHAPEDRLSAAISGVRTVLLLAVVAPIALASGILGVILWGLRTGVVHGLFTGALGLLLADVLLVGFRRIPFACTYYPAGSRGRRWPVYVIALVTYSYPPAWLEAAMLDRPLLLGAVFSVVFALVAALSLIRRRDLEWPPGFVYEEEDPDAAFGGFRLSEGLAAESPAPPRPRPVGE